MFQLYFYGAQDVTVTKLLMSSHTDTIEIQLILLGGGIKTQASTPTKDLPITQLLGTHNFDCQTNHKDTNSNIQNKGSPITRRLS